MVRAAYSAARRSADFGSIESPREKRESKREIDAAAMIGTTAPSWSNPRPTGICVRAVGDMDVIAGRDLEVTNKPIVHSE